MEIFISVQRDTAFVKRVYLNAIHARIADNPDTLVIAYLKIFLVIIPCHAIIKGVIMYANEGSCRIM